jgi:hypothetical protein
MGSLGTVPCPAPTKLLIKGAPCGTLSYDMSLEVRGTYVNLLCGEGGEVGVRMRERVGLCSHRPAESRGMSFYNLSIPPILNGPPGAAVPGVAAK